MVLIFLAGKGGFKNEIQKMAGQTNSVLLSKASKKIKIFEISTLEEWVRGGGGGTQSLDSNFASFHVYTIYIYSYKIRSDFLKLALCI